MAVRVLFVCSGNICRSPSAEAVMRARDKLGIVECDSCGLESYHIGQGVDERAAAVLSKREIDSSYLRARQLQANDFENFDWILAMDYGHLSYLRDQHPQARAGTDFSELQPRVVLFLDKLEGRHGQDVLDPYYGDRQNFESMLDDIEKGVDSWLSFFASLQP